MKSKEIDSNLLKSENLLDTHTLTLSTSSSTSSVQEISISSNELDVIVENSLNVKDINVQEKEKEIKELKKKYEDEKRILEYQHVISDQLIEKLSNLESNAINNVRILKSAFQKESNEKGDQIVDAVSSCNDVDNPN